MNRYIGDLCESEFAKTAHQKLIENVCRAYEIDSILNILRTYVVSMVLLMFVLVVWIERLFPRRNTKRRFITDFENSKRQKMAWKSEWESMMKPVLNELKFRRNKIEEWDKSK